MLLSSVNGLSANVAAIKSQEEEVSQLIEVGQTEVEARALELERVEVNVITWELKEKELLAEHQTRELRMEELDSQLAAMRSKEQGLKLKARRLNKKKSDREMINEDLTASKER